MTPDEARARVVAAAREIVRSLNLPVITANFSRASCNERGEAPFRGEVDVFYRRPDDVREADAQLNDGIERLRRAGWSDADDFHGHGTVLTKDGVDAVFHPANVSVPQGHIVLLGECRDVTSTKDQAGTTEHVALD